MALINCKECEKKFSNLAYACPKCGAPTAYSTGTNEGTIQTDTPSSFDLLEAVTCNQIMDYYWNLHNEITRLGGEVPEKPKFNEEAIVRAVITRMVHFKRMFLTISPIDGKPHIEFIPSNCWVIDSENIVRIIADREGPKKELLPDIIQAAVNRLAKAP
ncbi:hypothetical protein AO727_17855 [Acinetobacter baumannii]|uniref:hypothetical protein n=1 Tax=Acinetobacter baumannii TaxID=470 RepID=UPI0007185396|nr:hypothetical protein [Acinetobacter baumannii]KRW34739.1 hypothetical protein AO727_17855 [Acinetobacter baumannii]MDC4815657.1 hypothetical protein [Acinetobacter baumannii]MDH2620536.1 hypothetical protein [Acinetobacter baumannii]MDV7473196.1 hypothetical protein [Acinetobacter baumannii]CAI3122163.1 hypothetical protein MWMV4_MWMV4_03581 [Acinetobacter baumannii]